MKKVTVLFEPEGKKVETLLGSTIFKAAKVAGIRIRSDCSGKGLCGKCRVIVKKVGVLSELTEIEKRFLSETEIDLGYRLACQAEILGNITVLIPSESRLGVPKLQITGIEKLVKPDPTLKKFYLILPKPSLLDARPDYERLIDTLSNVVSISNMDVSYQILKKLSDRLRDSDFNVTVAVWNNRKIISIEEGDTSNELYGFALDLGTSKIVCHLVNLTTGETLDIESIENPQLLYGEDIMTRITFAAAKPENQETMQKLIVNGINRILDKIYDRTKIDSSKVYEVVVVGNTAMLSFLLGFQPKYIAMSPFVATVKRQMNFEARELGININPFGIVTTLPVIGGFVGADAVADVIATGVYESDELSLLVDIGTNTEIFVGDSKHLFACSCASGPAFEGMHIKNGMRAAEGAIEKVRISSDLNVEYETIGRVRPIGLCGSAMVDIVAEMFKHNIIDSYGRFNLKKENPRLKVNNGEVGFVVAWGHETATGKEIIISQKDIHEIQLAKAAIYAGCSVLMKRRNIKVTELEKVLIAGALGNYVNPKNAKILGLLPDVPVERIKFVGNTAIVGAKMALLSKDVRKKADIIARKVHYIELSIDPNFKEEFLKAILIPLSNKCYSFP
ncbi:MAG: ASKHA domain-containing protein [Nitrososphaeria archaeon]